MIKFFTLKQEQKQEQQQSNAAGTTTTSTSSTSTTTTTSNTPNAPPKKIKASQIRVQRDMAELSLPKGVTIDFPNPDDLLHFRLTLVPDEGLYQGGVFEFTFTIKDNYPHEPPKVRCSNKIYHPNIDLEGGVCLNILRDDWMPVLTIQSVIYGLQYLFLEPNPDDPLNKEAADVLRSNRKQFEDNVRMALRGGMVNRVKYDRVLNK